MGKAKGPQKISDIKGDIAVALRDETRWDVLAGCSLIIAPPGALFDKESEMPVDKAVTRMEELNPDSPYGVIALDTLLRNLPLSKLLEYRASTTKTLAPEPVKKEKKNGTVRPGVRRRK